MTHDALHRILAMEVVQAIAIIVGVVSGVAGLVLGILNQIHQRDTTRPRLRVRPRVLHIVDRDPDIGRDMSEKNVGVMEICNVGNMPVMGSTIGFKPKRKGQKGLLVVSPEPLSGDRWPSEIQPGHMVMLRMKLDAIVEPIKRREVGPAFVSSMVGDTFTASRRDMKVFRKSLLAAAPELAN